MGPSIRFVVLGQSRSGSTLVVRLLDSHPEMVCEGELFNPDWGYYPRRLLKVARRLPDAFLWNRVIRCRSEAYGAKVLVYHVHNAPGLFSRLDGRGWKLIAVTRRDVLRMALSQAIAQSTTTWHRYVGDPPAEHRVTVDPDLIIERIGRRHRMQALEQQILTEVEHFSLEYERDLQRMATRRAALNGVLDYLGVSRSDLDTDLSPSDHRPLPEVVANLDQVLEAVAGSPWAYVLDRFDPGVVGDL